MTKPSIESSFEYFHLNEDSFALVNFFTNEIKVMKENKFFRLYKFKRELIIQDIADIKNDLSNQDSNICLILYPLTFNNPNYEQSKTSETSNNQAT